MAETTDRSLALVQDCHAAYLSAPDKLHRQFNQAFFERLLIDAVEDAFRTDEPPIEPELALAGTTPATVPAAPRLTEKTMVETMGLEPTTPCCARTSRHGCTRSRRVPPRSGRLGTSSPRTDRSPT